MTIYLNNVRPVNFGLGRFTGKIIGSALSGVTGALKGGWEGFKRDGFPGLFKGAISGAVKQPINVWKRYALTNRLEDDAGVDKATAEEIARAKVESPYDIFRTSMKNRFRHFIDKDQDNNNRPGGAVTYGL